jgi:hypothetical protein
MQRAARHPNNLADFLFVDDSVAAVTKLRRVHDHGGTTHVA